MRTHGLTAEQVDHALNKESGLLGVSGVSGDVRKLWAAGGADKPRAVLALGMFAYRIRLGIAAAAAALGGLDALVFAGGVGEHDARVREWACVALWFLGVRLDPAKNNACTPDADISAADAPCRTLVVHTREDVSIAREVGRVLAGGAE